MAPAARSDFQKVAYNWRPFATALHHWSSFAMGAKCQGTRRLKRCFGSAVGWASEKPNVILLGSVGAIDVDAWE